MVHEFGLDFPGRSKKDVETIRRLLLDRGATEALTEKEAQVIIGVEGDATAILNTATAWGGQVVWHEEYPDR